MNSSYERNATKAESIKADDLVEEILPLLGDYFNGKFIKTPDGIKMSMENGQEFQLCVKEIQ